MGHPLTAVAASCARRPDAIKGRPPRETGFSRERRVAASPVRECMEIPSRHIPVPGSDESARIPWTWAPFACLPRLLSAESLSAFWPLERREAPAEATVAVRGRVEIRWLRAGCVARTCVKGGQAAAFGTALARLRRYAHGDNHHGLHLVTARSALQWQVAPGRWLVGVRLNDIEAADTAPVARTPKIALIWTEPEFLAVVRVHGRPTSDRIERGDTIVLNALADSEWLVSGVPMIRLHKCGLVRWLTRGFEVVVPVAERRSDSVMRNTRLPGRPDPAVTPGSGRATR